MLHCCRGDHQLTSTSSVSLLEGHRLRLRGQDYAGKTWNVRRWDLPKKDREHANTRSIHLQTIRLGRGNRAGWSLTAGHCLFTCTLCNRAKQLALTAGRALIRRELKWVEANQFLSFHRLSIRRERKSSYAELFRSLNSLLPLQCQLLQVLHTKHSKYISATPSQFQVLSWSLMQSRPHFPWSFRAAKRLNSIAVRKIKCLHGSAIVTIGLRSKAECRHIHRWKTTTTVLLLGKRLHRRPVQAY